MADNMVKNRNAFVKAEQAKMAGKMGDEPSIPADMKRFNAYMSNDGQYAQDCARRLTSGLEDAFPVD